MIAQIASESFAGSAISFRTADGWVNATQMAKAFGKRTENFLRTDSAKAFIAALEADLAVSTVTPKSVTVRQGGIEQGTWMHPDLALEFARWLSPEFAIWTNRVIRRVLAGNTLDDAAAQRISAETSRIIGMLEQRVAALEDFVTRPKTTELRNLNLPLGRAGRRGRKREHHLPDFLPAIQAAAAHGAGWSELFRAASALRSLGHGTFCRVLGEAIASGAIVGREDGRYYAPAEVCT
jgi:hypothetical protein